MNKYKTILVFFFLTSLFAPNAQSQLVGFQVSLIEPQGNFGKIFLPSFSYEIYSNFEEMDDHFKYGMAIDVTVLNPGSDTINFGVNDIRLYKKTYEFNAGLIMVYNILKEKFTPFVGLDLFMMCEKYNFTQLSPYNSGFEKNVDIGLSATPKIGCSYEFLDDIVLNAGAGFVYRYKIGSDQQESFFKYFISIGYYF